MSAHRCRVRLPISLAIILITGAETATNAAAAGRSVVAGAATIARGSAGVVAINLEAQGNENALGFSVSFDPALLTYSSAAAGTGASSATVNINDSQKLGGKIGVVLALQAGQSFAAGPRELVRLTFVASPGSETLATPVGFSDSPVVREISDPLANALTATYVAATITLAGDGSACSGPFDLVVPASAHKQGVGGSMWYTDLSIVNIGSGDAAVNVSLLKENADNSQPLTKSYVVPVGRARRLTDVLGTELPSSGAALGIRECSGTVLANARFYNTASPCGGTYGMYIPGMSEARALDDSHQGIFHNLAHSTNLSTGFRVNMGFASVSSFLVGVSISLYGDAGQLLGAPVTRDLKPYEHMQFTRIHSRYGTEVTNGTARVTVTTAGGKVHPYAMLIDNISGDPIYMPVEVQEDTDYPFHLMLDP